MPAPLDALKAGGYKIVHVKASAPAETLAEYDALIEKDAKGLPGAGLDKPTSSIVKTVPNALKRTDAALRARAATLPPFCHPLHSGD